MKPLLPTLLLATCAATALAQVSPVPSQPPTDPAPAVPGQAHPGTANAAMTFQSLDKNADQRISKAEAVADRTLNQSFATLDANQDGSLTMAEFAMYKPRSEAEGPARE